MKFTLDYRSFISDRNPVVTMQPSTRGATIPKSRDNESSTSTRRSLTRYPLCRLHEERLHNPFPARATFIDAPPEFTTQTGLADATGL